MTWAADVNRVPPNWDYDNFDAERDEYPAWPKEQRTHWQWWQSKTDPSPISPIFSTPEEMASYAVANQHWPYFEPWAFGLMTVPQELIKAIRKDGERP
jgi:hypothetical protein